jgi:Spy/CpxP family protein refolding chaperone
MMETLDVTDTQRDSIWKIIDDRRSAQRKLASDIQSQHKALRELNTSSNSDLGKVKEIASTLSSLIEEQIVESANIMILVHNVLTDEQKKKMEEQKQTRGKQYQSCSK